VLNSDAVKRVCEVFQSRIGEINQSAALRLNSYFEDYTEADLVYAFEEAARQGVTSWRYIESILERRVKEDTSNPDKFASQGVYSNNVLSDPQDILAAWNKRKTKISLG